jgi:hypothetical protein
LLKKINFHFKVHKLQPALSSHKAFLILFPPPPSNPHPFQGRIQRGGFQGVKEEKEREVERDYL